MDRLLYGVEEAAERLSIGRSKMWELLSAGAIRSVKIDSRRLVPADALAEYVRKLSELEPAR